MEKSIKLDFDELQEYRLSDRDELPIVGLLSFYKAIGLMDIASEYKNEYPDFVFIPLDNFKCNFNTLRKIRDFIENNWATFDITITEDNGPRWKKNAKREQHDFLKTIKPIIRRSLNSDFANYCPGLDDNVSDDIIVMTIEDRNQSGN